jgi:hypothetical protein
VAAARRSGRGAQLHRPARPKPLANVTVKRGKTAKLRYRINDAACPQARATLKIKRGSKVIKTISLGAKATGRDLVYSWKCSLARGAYTWTVLATDLAGIKQAKTVTKKLIVK